MQAAIPIDNPQGILDYIAKIPGPMKREECEVLFTLAQEATDGAIVEIGSFHGKSTLALASGSMCGALVPVYAIDPHEHFEGVLGGKFTPHNRKVFFKNMLQAGVVETVRLINLPSVQVSKGWEQDIALLWVDGDHRYEGVKADFESWHSFIKSGGYLVFDDSTNQEIGPYQVIEEIKAHHKEYTVIETVGKITVLQKNGA